MNRNQPTGLLRKNAQPFGLGFLPLVACMAALLGTLLLGRTVVDVTDDAFITFRCARNLAEGHGLVFNVGERVEGMTSLLWALLMAIPIAMGWACDTASIAMGSLCGVGTVVLTAHLTQRLTGAPWAALVAGLSVAAQPIFWQVSANGMEMGLYALLLVATTACVLTSASLWLTAGLGVLLFMTRPEGSFLWGLTAIYGWLRHRCRSAVSPDRGRIGGALLLWLFGILAVSFWRFWYYGDWIPNSVRAKSVPLDAEAIQHTLLVGGRYVWRYLMSVPLLTVSVLVGFVVRLRRLDAWFLVGVQAAAVAIALRNGGDHMPGYRLLTVYMPVGVVLVGAMLESVRVGVGHVTHRWRVVMPVAWVLLALWGWGMLAPFRSLQWSGSRTLCFWQNPQPWSDPYSEFAKRILPNLVPEDRLSASNIGRFGYLTWPHHVHDRLGLTDRHIARHGTYIARYGRMDPAYTLNVIRPDVMVVSQKNRIVDLQPSVYEGNFRQDWMCFAYHYSKARSLYGVVNRKKAARILNGVPFEELDPCESPVSR